MKRQVEMITGGRTKLEDAYSYIEELYELCEDVEDAVIVRILSGDISEDVAAEIIRYSNRSNMQDIFKLQGSLTMYEDIRNEIRWVSHKISKEEEVELHKIYEEVNLWDLVSVYHASKKMLTLVKDKINW